MQVPAGSLPVNWTSTAREKEALASWLT
ncbi:hypothetical protein Q604_UNBC02610G0002, partial [human gut metagenome]